MEARLVERAGIPFQTIPAAGIHGVDLRQLPANIYAIFRGIKEAARILDEFKPDVVFFTGGFVAGPMAIPASLRRIPILMYVPDIEPGLALKVLAIFAQCITVTTDDSRQFFSKKANIVTSGYPLRSEMVNWLSHPAELSGDKLTAREHFGIKDGRTVLLVFGGSKGAHSINLALLANVAALLHLVDIIHISGELDWSLVEAAHSALLPDLAAHYHVFPYLHEDMGAALAAADLVVSRAGASVLGEFPYFGIPAILVPYPHAWRYQMVNAEALSKQKAAIIIEDAHLKSGLMLTIEKLLETPEKMDEMRSAMRGLRSPDAACIIARLLTRKAEAQTGGVNDQS